MAGDSHQTLAALDAIWAKYASGWRRLLSHRMITELRLRASYDLDLLAPLSIANKIPKGTIPDCARCQDICCAGIENVVSLRLRDVAMLIDIERTDLISTRKPRFPQRLMLQRPALWELMGSELFLTLPVLRQIDEQRICAALGPDMQCSLHPHWPVSCERFPYMLKAKRHIVWGSRCQSKQVDPAHEQRQAEMAGAAVATFNERVRDAVLLAHARPALDRMGIGAFLTDPASQPFETPSSRLPILG